MTGAWFSITIIIKNDKGYEEVFPVKEDKKETKADLVVHPIRLRIIRALAGGRRKTPLQLAELMSDVPQATLYRHLKKLADAGLLLVVEERPVRGAVEKVYALAEQGGIVTAEDLQQATPDDHMRYFMTFLTGLMSDFGRYLQREDIDLVRDGVGYRQVPLYLTDQEFQQLAMEMTAPVRRALQNEPTPERKRRLLTTIVMPVEEEPKQDS